MRSLLDVIETDEFDHDGCVRIISAEQGEPLTLKVELFPGGDAPPTRWQVRCHEVREQRLDLSQSGGFMLSSDHPLLWPWTEASADLYCASRPVSPLEAIGALWVRHQQETAGAFPLHRFVNPLCDLRSLFDSGFGLLARGPERLLAAFADALGPTGARVNLVRRSPPRFWDSQAARWCEGSAPLQALILGDSYVVATMFHAVAEA